MVESYLASQKNDKTFDISTRNESIYQRSDLLEIVLDKTHYLPGELVSGVVNKK